MEQLDQLGLYGKQLTVVGHSMGGAAGLQMGLTIDEMRPAAERPEMRYVLLAPAAGPDSVPFLMHGIDSALISLQNSLGTALPPDVERQMTEGVPPSAWAYLGNLLVGPAVVNGLIPGAPQYVRDVHSSFANEYGFQALASQASGLLHQGYPDPEAVRDFMRDHPVVVVAATEDKLVDPTVVRDVFGPGVLTVEGNHYAHLGNLDHPEWGPLSGPVPEGSPRDLIWDRVRAMLERPYHASSGGGGGRGVHGR
jgi:pimeloyl-ACP methyl ester carboxylesterase